MVKKKKNSKRTYIGTKKTMKARRRWEDKSKNKRENKALENPSPMQENKQISEMKKIYEPLVKKKESRSKRTYNGTRTQWNSQKKRGPPDQKQRENAKRQEERKYESVSGTLQN